MCPGYSFRAFGLKSCIPHNPVQTVISSLRDARYALLIVSESLTVKIIRWNKILTFLINTAHKIAISNYLTNFMDPSPLEKQTYPDVKKLSTFYRNRRPVTLFKTAHTSPYSESDESTSHLLILFP